MKQTQFLLKEGKNAFLVLELLIFFHSLSQNVTELLCSEEEGKKEEEKIIVCHPLPVNSTLQCLF